MPNDTKSEMARINPGAPHVSVVIPTLNEADNIDPLISGLLDAFRSERFGFEIIVADGGSTDDTQARVEAWQERTPIKLVAGDGIRGLAGDVLAGAAAAQGEVLVVMDADLSHPPATAPILARHVLDDSSDMAIASRYVKGGQTPDWRWTRRVISRAATILAWPLVEVSDPLSGFFAIRRKRLLAVDPKAKGFKIGLEALVDGGANLRVVEVPISFYDRVHGVSKIGMNQISAYLQRLTSLAGAEAGAHNVRRPAMVGLLTLVTDVGAFQAMRTDGFDLASAHILSFTLATLIFYLFSGRRAFALTTENRPDWSGHARFLILFMLVIFLRGGVLSLLVERVACPERLAIFATFAISALVSLIGGIFFVCPPADKHWPKGLRWRVAAVGIMGYVLVLRLVYLGLPDLLPEEAYYWNYAQHLDLSYLDHPPMVAWMISAGTALFGNTEFGVRIGPLLCGLITVCFCFGFARNIANRGTAIRTALLVAVLPFFFIFGMFMTPDAPLITCWAATLFFLERALMGQKRLGWWYAGLCLGLGMLSKYTIALLCPAAAVFMLLDRQSRRWFLRPEPYTGILLAMLLFTPVIVWNAQHDWVSFWFQGSRRIQGASTFSLHLLIGSAFLLITPIGLIGTFKAIFDTAQSSAINQHDKRARRRLNDKRDRRKRMFTAVFTLVPLSVFVLFSFSHEPKLNWTGPIWLAVLPMLARQLEPRHGVIMSRIETFGQRLWPPTLATVLLLFGGFFHYLVLGLPGVGYRDKMHLPVAWEELAHQVEQIEEEIEHETGEEPLVVGMDKYFLASELAFYRRHETEGVEHSSSRHLFNLNGLMYAFWFPPESQVGRTLILVSLDRKDLADELIADHVLELGPIREQVVTKHHRRVARYYYRLAHGYHTTNLASRSE